MPRLPPVVLGDSGLRVSKLGFGTVEFGVKSNNITPEEGSSILIGSHRLGVNYWDTSDDYGSHPHVAGALRRLPREEVVLSTKTGARTSREATRSLKASLKELGTDYVDIFFLHYVKSDWIDGCRRVLKELGSAKKAGTVKALGLSTHSVVVAEEAHRIRELDVLMTIYCRGSQAMVRRYPRHIPLVDGSIEEMLQAIELAHDAGKGVVAMKVLGTGAPPLIRGYRSSIRSVARIASIDSMVIGMRNMDEVRKNVRAFVSR